MATAAFAGRKKISSTMWCKVAKHWSKGLTAYVCDNTCLGGFNRAQRRGHLYTLKHVPGAKFSAADAREMLEVSIVDTMAFAKDIEMAFNMNLTDDQIAKFFDTAVAVPEEEGRSRNTVLRKRAELSKILNRDPRVPDAARKTVGGLWQATNTWWTWGQEIRRNDDPIGRQHMNQLLNKEREALMRFLGEFGLSPAMRAPVVRTAFMARARSGSTL